MLRCFCTIVVAALMVPSPSRAADEPSRDPLVEAFRRELKPAVVTVLKTHKSQRKYTDADFPMPPERFAKFRKDIIDRLSAALKLREWMVRSPVGKKSPIASRFRDRVIKTITYEGVTLELHVVEIPETGDRVPMVLCLPPGKGRHPGVCCFSGHSRHGLRDLVLDQKSYQRGIAVRLAKAGLASIAVEKIDTGYLSRNGTSGVDENEIATFRLAWGRVTRSHQLMACLAAAEILAAHPRVDETKIGATGVSLGGWLSMQTAVLSDRIAAVADFGRKTVAIPPGMTAKQFRGMTDLCHIIPGMAAICDRNLLSLAYCPRPLLAGHGRKDAGSHRQGPVHFKSVFAGQYRKLGRESRFRYHVHDGGDTMPEKIVVEYFREVFGLTKASRK